VANLGNIGHYAKTEAAYMQAWHIWGLDKHPVQVDMAFTGVNASSVPLSYLALVRNTVELLRTRTDASGVGHFYDMDDSGGQVYSISGYTQDGATGEAWTATVVGSVATVTKVFAAQRAVATAFT